MRKLIQQDYGMLLLHGLILGLEIFIVYLLLQKGLIQILIEQDKSLVSRVIFGIYALASMQIIYSAYCLSMESLALATKPADEASRWNIHEFFKNWSASSEEQSQNLLLQVLEDRCRGYFSFGYIVADLMLKLGLLGTVIGFIFMLGSLSGLNSVDINVMQKLLAEMSGGMKVALFTTLTGMVSGMLLYIKYHILDWGVDMIINEVKQSIASTQSSPQQ